MKSTRRGWFRTVTASAVLALTLGTGVMAMTGTSAVADTGTGYLSTSGGKIVDSTGKVVTLTGLNWFGMETDNKTFHGLWASVTWRSQLDHMAALGYNTLRVPFSDDALKAGATATGINDYVNPDLVGLSPLQILDKVVDYVGTKGMRVILDRHRPTAAGQTALWYTAAVPESTWIADWVMLANHYAGNSTVIGADLHNEPHSEGTKPNSTGACWGCGDTTRDWRLAAERAGNAILAVQPNWLIFVEGVSCPSGGDNNIWDNDTTNDEFCGWWGGNLSKAADYPVRLNKTNKLVYSPHEYGVSVYEQEWFKSADFPGNLPAYFDKQWGYLVKQNIAPLMMGEFGSTLADARDTVWLTALMKYLGQNGISFTYWAWNPNSGDTGGIVQDDWVTVNQNKQSIIQPYLNPPSTNQTTTTTTTTRPTTTTTTTVPTTTTTTRPTTTTTVPTTTTTTRPTTTTTVPTTTTTTRPTTTTTTPTTTTTTGGTGGACTATVKLPGSWPGGYQGEITVKNNGTSTIGSWIVTFAVPTGVTIGNGWNGTFTQSGTTITVTAPAWSASLAPGASAVIGFIANGPSSPLPSGVTLNGAACTA
jgi:endoglucanase